VKNLQVSCRDSSPRSVRPGTGPRSVRPRTGLALRETNITFTFDRALIVRQKITQLESSRGLIANIGRVQASSTKTLRGESRSAAKYGVVMGSSPKYFYIIGAASWGDNSWRKNFSFSFRRDNRTCPDALALLDPLVTTLERCNRGFTRI